MKKMFGLMMVLTLVAGFMVGCGGSNFANNGTTINDTNEGTFGQGLVAVMPTFMAKSLENQTVGVTATPCYRVISYTYSKTTGKYTKKTTFVAADKVTAVVPTAAVADVTMEAADFSSSAKALYLDTTNYTWTNQNQSTESYLQGC